MRIRCWPHWALLLLTACGSAPPPHAEIEQTRDEPSVEGLGAEGPGVSAEGPSAPIATLRELPRCTARSETVPRLDSAPSIHPLAPATVLNRVTTTSARGAPFGDAVYGFVWWHSANGRFALLMRFGAEMPRFGHHGEVAGSRELWLVDVADGSHETISEMIAAATGALAYRDMADRVWILREDGQRTNLSALGADTREDANRCLDRRQAGFDVTGRFVSWLARDPSRVIVEDLASGARCQVESGPGEIWRARPLAAPGWVLIREVPTDSDGDGQLTFPIQRTSCACRWCNRFAMSMGYYGWGGDAFESVLVAPDGARQPVEGQVYAVGDETTARVDTRAGTVALVDGEGRAVAIPAGCAAVAVAPGAPSVLLRCGDESRLFFPDEGRVLGLPARVEAGSFPRSHVTADGHVWTPIRASTDDGQTWNIARLRMNDGRIETGPVVTALTGVDGDWVSGRHPGGVALLDLTDGDTATIALGGIERVRGLTVALENDRTAQLGPAVGRAVIVEGPAGPPDPEGCTLVPADHGERGVDLGPWQRVCP